GRRALVLVKHVGMNLLSDPLITSVTHTIGAGLVIIAGDDPGAKGSQNEQDSRWYGKLAEVAVFDPHDPDSAYRAVRRAYTLSEETKVPVILRITVGLEKSQGKINRLSISKKPYSEFDRSIWALRMREKHRHFHEKIYPLFEAEAETTGLNVLVPGRAAVMKTGEGENKTKEEEKPGKETGTGIISSGFVSALVKEVLKKHPEVSHLSLNLVNPLPFQKIRAFLEKHEIVLVAEESEPFIEEQLCITGKIRGKKTGHLPYGQVLSGDLEFALEHIMEGRGEKPIEVAGTREVGENEEGRKRKKSRTSICEDCSFLPLYRLLRGLDVRVAGDMGCSVRSAPEPLEAVDVSFALGSAISVACGFEKKGIAVIGDFALAHSGILGLMNAVHTGADVLVLVLDNRVAAMTGGQEVPDLQPVVEALVPDTRVFELGGGVKENDENGEKNDESSDSGLLSMIEEKLCQKGVSVIFIRGKCSRYL
ncbi:MAG: thiamine pyrophosphate-dependent enzyme, partial [Methanosarcinaceae archaeon]|nr:thiamine pyrophosphate-dependent enzyme [Methanosarcinaceae archaeon]